MHKSNGEKVSADFRLTIASNLVLILSIKGFFRRLYDKKKLVFFVLYGWFPVKLRTYAAEPIYYDQDRTVDELVSLTKKSIENLIDKYQHKPGNTWNAVYERFESSKERKFK